MFGEKVAFAAGMASTRPCLTHPWARKAALTSQEEARSLEDSSTVLLKQEAHVSQVLGTCLASSGKKAPNK